MSKPDRMFEVTFTCHSCDTRFNVELELVKNEIERDYPTCAECLEKDKKETEDQCIPKVVFTVSLDLVKPWLVESLKEDIADTLEYLRNSKCFSGFNVEHDYEPPPPESGGKG